MHSANIIHRDLKPSNLLLNSNCDLRICDLGLARGIYEVEGPQKLTEYVVTRWYRAPEIMLAARYSKAADIWSCGTIFAELLRRKPLFPGNDYLDQLRLIINTLGSPSESDTWYVTSERAKAFLAKNAGKPKIPWTSVIKRANPLALDLLEKMLAFDPSKRITVEDALKHPYLSTLHCSEDEPVHPAGKYDFSFEIGFRHEKPNIQRLIYKEIEEFRKEKERQQQLQQQQAAATAAVAGSGSGSGAAAIAEPAVKKPTGSFGGGSGDPPIASHSQQPSQSQRIAAAAGLPSSASGGSGGSGHQARSFQTGSSRKASSSSSSSAVAPVGGSSGASMETSPPAAAAAAGSFSGAPVSQRPVIPPLGLKGVAAATNNGSGGTAASATEAPAAAAVAASEALHSQHYQHRQTQSQTDRPRGATDTTGDVATFDGPAGTGYPSGASTQRSPVLLGMTKTADRLRRSQSSASLRGVANAAAASSAGLAGTAVNPYQQYPTAGPGSSRGGAPSTSLPALPSHRSTGGGSTGALTYRSGSGAAAAMHALQQKDNPLGSPPPRNSARGQESARRDQPVVASYPNPAYGGAEGAEGQTADGGTGATTSLPAINNNSSSNGGGGSGGSGGGVIKSLFGLLHRGNKQ
jgi:serine/threonine protein kinase